MRRRRPATARPAGRRNGGRRGGSLLASPPSCAPWSTERSTTTRHRRRDRAGEAPPGSWVVPVVLGAVVALGVVLRFVQRSPLWLDEALSVNIAGLPSGDLLDALRHDGHPPLYYLLLHYWMKLFGEGDVAVRALSGLFAVASLPLAWVAGAGLAGRSGARWALIVVALSPFWVRYATETRMYSLVMLLVLAGYLLIVGRPRSAHAAWRLVGIGLISGLLLLTHYWSFYLLAAVVLLLALRWWRQPGPADHPPGGSGGGAGFAAVPALAGRLPLPGGPHRHPVGRAVPAHRHAADDAEDLGGGEVTEAALYGSIVLVLVLVALFTVRSGGHEMALDLRTAPVVRGAGRWWAWCWAGLGGRLRSPTPPTRAATRRWSCPSCCWRSRSGITRVPGVGRLLVGLVYVSFSLAGSCGSTTTSAPSPSLWAGRWPPGPSPATWWCTARTSWGPAYSRAMPDGLVELSYPALDLARAGRLGRLRRAQRRRRPGRHRRRDPGGGRRPRGVPGVDDRVPHLRLPVRVAGGGARPDRARWWSRTPPATSSRPSCTGGRRSP